MFHFFIFILMASIKYGAIITGIKGKVGGTIIKDTGAGPVMQNGAPLIDKIAESAKLTKADAGRVIRPVTNTALNAGDWRNLTDTQRQAWNTSAPDFPFKNKFGEPYVGSGYQLYMQCNNNIRNVGATPIVDPPIPASVADCIAFTVSTTGGPIMQMDSLVSIPVGYSLTLYACSALSAGRGFSKGRMKAIKILDDATTFPVSLDSAYEAIIGTIPGGGVVWFQGWMTNVSTGRMGQPYTTTQSL